MRVEISGAAAPGYSGARLIDARPAARKLANEPRPAKKAVPRSLNAQAGSVSNMPNSAPAAIRLIVRLSPGISSRLTPEASNNTPGNSAKTNQPAPSCASSQRSEEHTSELQSLMRISYAVFCLKKKKKTH